MKQWEYRFVNIAYDSDSDQWRGLQEIAGLGREGWELVSVATSEHGGSWPAGSFLGQYLLFFKRPIGEKQSP